MTLGQRISQYRKNLGISQEMLGERLGVSRQAVSKWETGAATPDMENLLALAREFGVSVAELTATLERVSVSDSTSNRSASEYQPSFRRIFWPLVCAMLALLLAGSLALTFLMNRPFSDPAEQSVEALPPEALTWQEQSTSSSNTSAAPPAPKTDFALIWSGAEGQEEFLKLGIQNGFFPFGTTLELTEPLENHDTDFAIMTSHLADCGAITVSYYHIEEDRELDPESPERESIWCLSSIVSAVRTPRGIHPGSTKTQVLEAYGDDLVYCRKSGSDYTIAPHDYYYAYQTPETGGAAMLLYMKDGIVSAIQIEDMAEWGCEAYSPDHITRFPLINGEPDFSMRQEQERENISDTRKIYIAWNQLVTNNNLSAEDRYAYRQVIFGLLPLIDWDEMRTLGATDMDPDAGIFGLIEWLSQQETYSPSEILWLQMAVRAKGLDGAYAERYSHVLTQAFFFNPVAFAKSLSSDALDNELRWFSILDVAYDAPWYEPQFYQAVETLTQALSNGAFPESQAGWARLLHLYLTAETEDGSFDNLPKTPMELEPLTANGEDWWEKAWEENNP